MSELTLEPAAVDAAVPSRRDELREVIALAIPIVLTTSSRMVMDITDYVMITWLNDSAAQAAILPAQMIMWCYIVLGLGTMTITNTFAAQNLGRGRLDECSAYGWQSVYLALGFGAVGLALTPWLRDVIDWIGHTPEVRHQEWLYASVGLLTVAPTIAAKGLDGTFTGIHRPWVAMWSMVEANVVNMAVSYVLIFGAFGLPAMGIAGAAWGTLAGVSYRTLRLAATMLTPAMHAQCRSRSTWRPSPRRMLDLLRVGGPAGMQWFSDVLVWTLFVTVLIGRTFGTVHQIATNTVWQYLRVSFVPAMGIGFALTALVGKAVGRRDLALARRQAATVAWLTFGYMVMLSVAYWFWGDELVRILTAEGDQQDAVVAIGTPIMLCAAVFQLFDAVGMTYSAALRGAGDTFWPSTASIVGHWLLVIGGGWLAGRYFPQAGSLGPWIAASALIVLYGLYLWRRWLGGTWQKIDIFGEDKQRGSEKPSGSERVSG